MSDTDTDDQVNGHFQKHRQRYGVKVCQENISEIEGFDDCRIMRDEDGDPLGVEVKTTKGSVDIGMGGWIFEVADGEHYPISQDQVKAMYELVDQETDSRSNNGDAQPTPGPWDWSPQKGKPGGSYLAQVWASDGDSLATLESRPNSTEASANARLIAAAGTAASELPDGYDPIEVIKALPDILRAAERAVDSTDFRDEGEDDLCFPPDRSDMTRLRDTLDTARKDIE